MEESIAICTATSPGDHNISVRCESPPPVPELPDPNWTGPWTEDQWVCQKCKQKSDGHPPLFRECKSCAYKICDGCFYDLHDQQNARKAVQPPPIFDSLSDEEGGSTASGRALRRSLFAAAGALKRKMSESGEEVGGGSVLPRHGSKLAMKRAAGGVGGASAADKAAADKAAADKAAADKAAADKAAAIVIDLSRASDTYVHHLGVRFDYL